MTKSLIMALSAHLGKARAQMWRYKPDELYLITSGVGDPFYAKEGEEPNEEYQEVLREFVNDPLVKELIGKGKAKEFVLRGGPRFERYFAVFYNKLQELRSRIKGADEVILDCSNLPRVGELAAIACSNLFDFVRVEYVPPSAEGKRFTKRKYRNEVGDEGREPIVIPKLIVDLPVRKDDPKRWVFKAVYDCGIKGELSVEKEIKADDIFSELKGLGEKKEAPHELRKASEGGDRALRISMTRIINSLVEDGFLGKALRGRSYVVKFTEAGLALGRGEFGGFRVSEFGEQTDLTLSSPKKRDG